MPNKSTVSIEEAQLMELIHSWEQTASEIEEKETDAIQNQATVADAYRSSASQLRRLTNRQQPNLKGMQDQQERNKIAKTQRKWLSRVFSVLAIMIFIIAILIEQWLSSLFVLVAFTYLLLASIINWKRLKKDVWVPIISGLLGLIIASISIIFLDNVEILTIPKELLAGVSGEMMGAAFVGIIVLLTQKRIKTRLTFLVVFFFILGLGFALVFEYPALLKLGIPLAFANPMFKKLVSNLGFDVLGACIALLLVEYTIEKDDLLKIVQSRVKITRIINGKG